MARRQCRRCLRRQCTSCGQAARRRAPPPAAGGTARAAAERFAVAQRLVKMRQAFLEHRDHMSEAARTAMDDEFSAASRETEEALIWMLPWLGDDERAEAIRILAELRRAASLRLARRRADVACRSRGQRRGSHVA